MAEDREEWREVSREVDLGQTARKNVRRNRSRSVRVRIPHRALQLDMSTCLIARTHTPSTDPDREMTRFLRPLRGRNLGGMDSHVLRPITTAFGCSVEADPVVTVGRHTQPLPPSTRHTNVMLTSGKVLHFFGEAPGKAAVEANPVRGCSRDDDGEGAR